MTRLDRGAPRLWGSSLLAALAVIVLPVSPARNFMRARDVRMTNGQMEDGWIMMS